MQLASSERAFKIDQIATPDGMVIRPIADANSQSDQILNDVNKLSRLQDQTAAPVFAYPSYIGETNWLHSRLGRMSIMAAGLVCVIVILMLVPRQHPTTGIFPPTTTRATGAAPQALVAPDANWDERFIELVTDRALSVLRP